MPAVFTLSRFQRPHAPTLSRFPRFRAPNERFRAFDAFAVPAVPRGCKPVGEVRVASGSPFPAAPRFPAFFRIRGDSRGRFPPTPRGFADIRAFPHIPNCGRPGGFGCFRAFRLPFPAFWRFRPSRPSGLRLSAFRVFPFPRAPVFPVIPLWGGRVGRSGPDWGMLQNSP